MDWNYELGPDHQSILKQMNANGSNIIDSSAGEKQLLTKIYMLFDVFRYVDSFIVSMYICLDAYNSFFSNFETVRWYI
jgi:hypothetical protein